MPGKDIHPSESVSRYLIKGEIRSDGVVRHGAFLPSSSNLKHSVFRIIDLADEEIWTLAVEKVEPMRGRVIGRGDLRVSGIIENNLRVAPDENPESRHADIVGWPEDRDHRATIAKVLAALASPAKMREFSTEQTRFA
jgi:hypothetical protein